jgi:hypothetical protein
MPALLITSVDPVKVHQAFEGSLERGNVIIADYIHMVSSPPAGGGKRGEKKPGAPKCIMPSARLVDHAMGKIVFDFNRWIVRHPEGTKWRRADCFPKLSQLLNAPFGRVACNRG